MCVWKFGFRLFIDHSKCCVQHPMYNKNICEILQLTSCCRSQKSMFTRKHLHKVSYNLYHKRCSKPLHFDAIAQTQQLIHFEYKINNQQVEETVNTVLNQLFHKDELRLSSSDKEHMRPIPS